MVSCALYREVARQKIFQSNSTEKQIKGSPDMTDFDFLGYRKVKVILPL